MLADYSALQEEANHLAHQLFEDKSELASSFTSRLLDICLQAQDKDFLLVHNPGGWGNKALEQCLQWERGLVLGISDTIERLGYTCLLIQHWRSGSGWREWIRDLGEQFHFFATKARILAAELEFIVRHVDGIKVMLIGVSQGAAFTDAVMQKLPQLHQVYSIELGMFFPHLPHRVVGERTLVLDSNGLEPDAAVHRDIPEFIKVYTIAPFRWLKHLLGGRPVKFSYCTTVRGHDYDWNYPYVKQRVGSFLETNFGAR